MPRIRRVLVANRGEIALRILRSCRKLGLESVLAVSAADRTALPARRADRVICIGPPAATHSYLRAETIVQAALGTGADAIHPGYGFLSERASLAMLCEQHGISFIGPTAAQIAAVGDKLQARAHAQTAEVPVVPGGAVDSPSEAHALLAQLGPPVLIKAVGGGGGRGMQRIDSRDALDAALRLAGAEAGAAFGDARLYMERYVAQGRHIEVQVLGDGAGNVVHLGERDCSVQRRYQKLIEESPAPQLAPALRERICAAAVRFASRLAYRSAGTVEFLVDAARDSFYFLEMNARIQVEHPVTEMVSGVDLVAEQLAIANGEGLRPAVQHAALSGHAIECRINAEDPANDFLPSPGRVALAQWPSLAGVRVDTWIESGSEVPPWYDSLLGKIIAHGATRAEALARLRSALATTRIEGIATNLALQAQLVASAGFTEGGVHTGWLADFLQPAVIAGADRG